MVRTITLPSIFKITQLQFKIHTIRNCCTDGIRKALIDLQPNGSRGTPGCIANLTAILQGFGANQSRPG